MLAARKILLAGSIVMVLSGSAAAGCFTTYTGYTSYTTCDDVSSQFTTGSPRYGHSYTTTTPPSYASPSDDYASQYEDEDNECLRKSAAAQSQRFTRVSGEAFAACQWGARHRPDLLPAGPLWVR
jgi:hypothetical protein